MRFTRCVLLVRHLPNEKASDVSSRRSFLHFLSHYTFYWLSPHKRLSLFYLSNEDSENYANDMSCSTNESCKEILRSICIELNDVSVKLICVNTNSTNKNITQNVHLNEIEM